MSTGFHLSDAGSLGIHSMGLLAKKGKQGANSKEISRVLGASEAHLSKVMQRLAKAGLVHSTRGPQGGFVLALEPEQINLLTIFEALEGKLETESCILNKGECPFDHCILGGLPRKINREFKKYLESQFLSDL